MFYVDNRFIYIILGILILMSVVSYISNPTQLLGLILSLPAVLIAITFHEFAHAFAADKLGDDTARNQGRLTLNPLKHMDPVGFALLVFAHFGWGKPVQINPRNFTRKFSMSAGEAIVSLAGPLMNILLAILFTVITYVIIAFAPAFVLTTTGAVVILFLQVTVSVNVGLGIFNLIPLPPLDGSKILRHFLPYNAKMWFENHENIFYIAFMIIWITGLSAYIISPVISGVSILINQMVGAIFGLFI